MFWDIKEISHKKLKFVGLSRIEKSFIGTVVHTKTESLKIIAIVDPKPRKIKVRCTLCGFEKLMTKGHLVRGHGCGCTNRRGKISTKMNEEIVGTIVKDHSRHFKIKEYHQAGVKGCMQGYDVVCLDCGREFYQIVSSFTGGCGCGCRSMSKPESIMADILDKSGLEYEYDVPFEWSEKKRYDFYIPKLSMIIETHGLQHYQDVEFFESTASSQIENDRYKRNLAKRQGIERYYEIDCRYSDESYILRSIEETLPKNILDQIYKQKL